MTVYKTLNSEDKVSTKTLLHEAIPITGTIVSGTYADGNIQNFTHGMFQSVYDYPYLSSSANHIFDLSFGFHTTSSLYTAATSQKSKKNNVYNQMAQVLMGYDKDGNIQRFDEDGDLSGDGGTKINDAIFLPFSRLLVKDEIKKGSFQLELGVASAYTTTAVMNRRIKITDAGAATSYKVNSPAGEYGILVAETSHDGDATLSTPLIHGETIALQAVTSTKPAVGLLFYQAGIAVLNKSIFNSTASAATTTFTFGASFNSVNNGTVTIIDFAGLSKTYKIKNDSSANIANNEFNAGGSKAAAAENLCQAIEDSSGHNGSIFCFDSADRAWDDGSKDFSDGVVKFTQQSAAATHHLGNTILTTAASFDNTTSVNASSFTGGGNGGILAASQGAPQMNTVGASLETMLKSSEISSSADAIRNRIYNLQFNNTIELNSTVYFCRAKHNEFNYSSNPTYLSGSQIRVKNESTDIPISYITSIGLYSEDNQLLAVGKFSEPIRKDNNIELTFRARLDY